MIGVSAMLDFTFYWLLENKSMSVQVVLEKAATLIEKLDNEIYSYGSISDYLMRVEVKVHLKKKVKVLSELFEEYENQYQYVIDKSTKPYSPRTDKYITILHELNTKVFHLIWIVKHELIGEGKYSPEEIAAILLQENEKKRFVQYQRGKETELFKKYAELYSHSTFDQIKAAYKKYFKGPEKSVFKGFSKDIEDFLEGHYGTKSKR